MTDSNSPQHRSSSSSSGMILRVRRGDGSTADLYIAEGLTIGRSEANTVCLPDDESVDRSHARVELSPDGSLRLRSQSTNGSILDRDQPVTELVLEPGRTFQIGGARFECLSGLVETPTQTTPPDRCPACASCNIDQTGHLPRPCPDCGLALLPIRDGVDKPVQFVPAEYGDFTAVRYVARGGMGIVLQGLGPDGRSQVAIKLLQPRGDNDDDVRRFREEVRSLERIDHPHVVRVLSSGETSGFNYLVMEWIDGRSLRDIIRKNRDDGRLCDAVTAERWFREVLQGLKAIHTAGMIHRDIKPANILITSDGQARVSDLGLVKQLGDEATACTTTGMVPGTFEYMSPEQLSASGPIDERSDLYSLGVTFYELLTGERPHGMWTPPSQINQDVPEMLDATLQKLLTRLPQNRVQSATVVLNELSVKCTDAPSALGSDRSVTLLEITGESSEPQNTSNEILRLGCGVYGAVAACVLLSLLVVGYTLGDVALFIFIFGIQGLMIAGLTYSAIRGVKKMQLVLREFIQTRMPFLVRVFETCERNVLGQLGNELDGNEQPVSASAEYPTRFRHPWHLWGWTAIAAGLSANGLDELLLVLGRPASVGLLTATLPFACSAGLLILGFGILDKYWLCRGLPMKSVPKLRLTMIGLFILAVALIQLSSTISIIAAMSATVERAESATNTQPQVLHSPDGLCEITIPGDWVEGTEAIDIHPPPVITAFDSTSNILLMVYHESKADLRPMTLGEYLDLSMMRLADGTTEAINSQPVDLQINGYPAMSIELATIYEDERFTYPITVIDTPKRFFGIVGYSSPSQAVTARAGFEAITPTFVCLDTDR